MPPKAKGGKKKEKVEDAAGAAAAGEEADDAGSAAVKEELRELAAKAMKLRESIKREQDAFNEFQQQRGQLNYFWIVEKKNLEDKKADLRNKERELQDLEERHSVEIKVYKQRVKHLLYEHQNEVTQLKTESERELKQLQDDHREHESELKKDKRSLKIDLKEMELSHDDYIKSLKQEQDRNICKLRIEFERSAKELQQKHERRMKGVREELESRRKAEIARIQERKDQHTQQLMAAHETAFGEIKNYYNDITHNNLDRIKSLKDDVAMMKQREAQDERDMHAIAQENRRMSEPLHQAVRDVERLRQELAAYESNKTVLKEAKARLLVMEDSVQAAQWENEVLQHRYAAVVAERDSLYSQFSSAVYQVQQKTGFKNLLLEKRLTALKEALEKKEAQLNEVLASANLAPSVLGKVNSKLEDVIEAKNQSVRDLQQELERVVRAHNDVIRHYEARLVEYGIPKEELGFRPVIERLPAHAARVD